MNHAQPIFGAKPDAPMPAQPLAFEFHGQTGQFFRIWIVNVVLSILTLGIYSAWAKVRTKRYFYGSTVLDGASFEYHATPMQILKGRLIAFALLVVYGVANSLNPLAGMALLAVWLFLFPWVANLSLRFNARMSSYRNVRFGFEGSYGKAFLTFVVLPAAGLLSLGLLAPVAHRALSHYLAQNYRFGGKKFHAQLPLGRFYVLYLNGIGLFILASAILGVASITLLGFTEFLQGATKGQIPDIAQEGETAPLTIFVVIGYIITAVTYIVFLMIAPYIRAGVRNLVFGGLQLEGGHRFKSSLSPWRFAWISVSNLVAIVATLGLMLPWARIRMARYLAGHTAMNPAGDLSGFVSALETDQQAFGSEMADLAGIDIGL